MADFTADQLRAFMEQSSLLNRKKNQTADEMGAEILGDARDRRDNYDAFGLPKNPDALNPTMPAEPSPVEAQTTSSPSIFQMISNQMKNQEQLGNIGGDPVTSPLKTMAKGPAASTPDAQRTPATSIDAIQSTQAAPLDLYGSSLNDAALARAQAEAKQQRLTGNLANAGDTIANAFNHQQTYKDSGKNLIDQADQGVKDILTRRDAKDKEVGREKNLLELSTEKDKANPESDVSRLGQAIAAKLSATTGIEIKNIDKASWSSLEKAIPGLERYAGLMENANMRREMAAARKEDKEDRDLVKGFARMGDDMDINKARIGALGDVSKKLNSAERVEGLLKQFPDGNIPKTQTREIATSVAALISGNNAGGAVSQINELVPHSLVGDAAGMAEWFTNKPTGQNQQKFIQLLAETAQREKEISLNQIKRGLLGKVAKHEYLREKDPERFNNILLNTAQIKPEEYDEYKKGSRVDITGGLGKMNKPGATSEKIDSDMVAVISPEGKRGSIPKANLKKALERGFKEVK